LQPYDEKVWRQIEDRRRRVEARRGSVVPESARAFGKEVVVRGKERFEHLPVLDLLQQAIGDAMRGPVALIGKAAAGSVSGEAVLRRYEQRGHTPAGLAAIRALDLEVSDAVFPHRKNLAFISASAVQGAVAGAWSQVTEARAVAGGVAGAGARAVPDALSLARVLAADAAATLLVAARVVAETAAHYGYDPNDPDEELFMAGVLGVATAGSQGAKIAAHRELNHLGGLLARRASKAVLSETNLALVLPKVWPRVVQRLTHKQLGKATPVLGIALGFGLNANLMKHVSDEAYYAYRKRRLEDRYRVDRGIAGAPHDDVKGTLVLDLLEGDGEVERPVSDAVEEGSDADSPRSI